MPGERLSMRKIREVLRLRLGHGLPQRAVAQSLRLLLGRKIDASALCRNIVLISRFPAIIATTADLFSSKAHDDRAFAFNAAAMLACYVIWAIADSMLLPQDSVVIRFLRGNVARNNAV